MKPIVSLIMVMALAVMAFLVQFFARTEVKHVGIKDQYALARYAAKNGAWDHLVVFKE
jgi:hypothetical protein